MKKKKLNERQRARRDRLERALARYAEGPEMPARFADEVQLFATMNPNANTDSWRAFALELAGKAYREAYVRGFEHRERDPSEPMDAEAERERYEWSIAEDASVRRLLEEGDPADPLAGYPPDKRAQVLDEIGQHMGTHRVVLLGPDGEADAGDGWVESRR